MAKKEPETPAKPICSGCAWNLEAGGFRIQYKRDAYLHMEKCSVCGKRLPVHDGWVLGGKSRKANGGTK